MFLRTQQELVSSSRSDKSSNCNLIAMQIFDYRYKLPAVLKNKLNFDALYTSSRSILSRFNNALNKCDEI